MDRSLVSKLMIQIPAYNEEGQLARTIALLPRTVEGFSAVEILVVDDGSSDGTVAVAIQAGADHVVRLKRHSGLAAAFRAGLDAALQRGADVIVNTDADNQYDAAGIPALVAPILEGRAEMVIGARDLSALREASAAKWLLQKTGSWVVRRASGTDIPDATSGFRAISRRAALQLTVLSSFTYTLETIIQAGEKQIPLASVPIRTNPTTRPSRLFRSTFRYVLVSAGNILHFYTLYKPLQMFFAIAALCGVAGSTLFLRYVYLVFAGFNPSGHLQSIIVGAVFLVVGAASAFFGLIADLIAINRRLLDELLARIRRENYRQ